MAIGYIFLLLLASLPVPGIISYDFKQQIIALWQGWPISVSLLIWLLQGLIHRPQQGKTEYTAAMLNYTYAFAFGCSAIGHIVVVGISVLSPSPVALPEALHSTDLYPGSLLFPGLPRGEQRVESLEKGILRFLHWDNTLSALATLLWCSAVYYRHEEKGINWKTLCLCVATVAVFCGPCSVAIGLCWRDDHHLLQDLESKKKAG
jgi:hypothetical protein